LRYGEALADIEEALGQQGFHPYPGEIPTFEGQLRLHGSEVRLRLSFPCLRFTRYPIARLTHRVDDLPGAVAHIGNDDHLCYAAPGSIVLNLHAPGNNALTVLGLVENTLQEIRQGASRDAVVAEFPQHWLAALTVQVALSPQATEGITDFIGLERLGAPPLLIMCRQNSDGDFDAGAMGTLRRSDVDVVGEAWLGRTDRDLQLAGRTTPPTNLEEFLTWLQDVDAPLASRVANAVGSNFFGGPARILIQGPNGCVGGLLDPPKLWQQAAQTRQGWTRILRQHPARVSLQRWRGAKMDVEYARTRNLASGPTLAGRTIALIGCGTIGSHLARFLVQSGAGAGNGGRLLIVDTDVLSAGNLGRHWLTAQHIGASKAKACAKELKAQFIGVSVHALVDDAMTRLETLTGYDLVIDATGEEAVSRALNAELVARRPSAPDSLFVWLVGHGAAAQALFLPGVDDGKGCLACHRPHGTWPSILHEDAITDQLPVACGEAAFTPYGVAAPVIAAGLACRMAMEWTRGRVYPSLRSIRVDLASTNEIRDEDVLPRSDCPACGKEH
jgi:hypothetical protein